MPWLPELFSAPVLANLEAERRRDRFVAIPYFAGVATGEIEAMIDSFAGEPELQHPFRGRVRGERAFTTYVRDTDVWMAANDVTVEELWHITTPQRGFEEVVLHIGGKTDLPVAIVSDLGSDGRLVELRVYFSNVPLTGQRRNRPPVLQIDPDVRLHGVLAEYQAALAAGDREAIVAAFTPDGWVREPTGIVYRGPDALRAFYAQVFSHGGGLGLEHCSVVDDERGCALEYNIVRWGTEELLPAAGVAVYQHSADGKLDSVRIYDDVDAPL